MKPVSARVFLTYRCKCGCEWDKTPKEVKLLPGFICDNCQAFCKFDPVSDVIVKTMPKQVNAYDVHKQRALVPMLRPKPEEKKASTLTVMQKEAILALVAVGFKVAQATTIVKQLNCSTVEDYITQACRKNNDT